jgi:uncharacterized ubiquitin-like protein YukD
MNIKFKTMNGTEFWVEVTEPTLISDVKKKVQQESNILISQQRFVFSGKILSDDDTIGDYGIKDEDCVMVMLALRGG